MVGTTELTPLEADILALFYRLYGGSGFPRETEISVVQRIQRGPKRITDLEADAEVAANGHLPMRDAMIEMEEVVGHLTAVVCVANRRVRSLEVLATGPHGWDGAERRWTIRPTR